MTPETSPAIIPPPRFQTPVVIHDSPFKARNAVMLAPEGATLTDIVRMAGFVGKRILPHVHVYVDDLEVPQDRWHRVRPKEGRSVYIQVRLHGGGGDGEDKNPLRVILMLAVVVLAAYFGGPGALFNAAKGAGTLAKIGAFAANMAVSAAIATAGFYLVDAIVPPPRPPGAQYGWGQQDGNPYAMLTGIRNQFAPYAPIPRVLGKRRLFPLLAARPYTENLNGKQYLRMLLLVGYGRLRITDLRIGDTPITAFPGAAFEILEGTLSDAPTTLFTRVVREDGLTIKLQRTEDSFSGGSPPGGWTPGFDLWSTFQDATPDVPLSAPALVSPATYTFSDPGGWITRTTRLNTSEISLDMSAPRGMFRANAQGRRYETYVDVQVQYRAAGTTGSWLTPTWLEPSASLGTGTNGTIRVQALSADPIVRSARFSTGSSGQWDVRVKHNGPTRGSDPTYVDDVYWTALRSISTDTPVTMPGLAQIALRLEASEQLNGAPDTINCLAESYLPTFNGTSWDDANPVITSNPAWAYAHVMRWRGQNRVIPDSRIDGPGIKAWADACAATAPNASEPRWTYDNVIEGGSIYTALQDIAGHGRASFTILDGKYSVVRDVEQTVPVQVITPRNSSSYEGRKAFVDIPHAFRCTFSNRDKNNEPDEVIVYRDGYAKEAGGGNVAATKFEILNFPAATSSTQAWREGRYHLATLLLRPEEHSISMDIEHVRCTKGDLVRLQYDVIKVGSGSGRISGRTVSGPNVTHFDLDSPVTMETGQSYALRVRRRNGAVVLLPVVTVNGFQETVQLVTPIAASTAPDAGDLYAFGQAGIETAPMIVKSIEAGEDLTARLTLVDAQAGVWTADTGTIPTFNTFISGRRHVQDAPAIPSISLTSSEAALLRLADGTLQERLLVRIIPRGNDQIAVARFEVQFRNAGGGDWTPAAQATPEAPIIYITNVTQGEAYDVRVRAWSNGGTPSAWATLTNHTIIGKTTRPADVTGLTVSRRIDGVVLTFNAVTDIDLWAYEVRRGGTGWSSASHVGFFTATTIGLQESLSADTVYRVKAVDVIGLDSLNAASVTASGTLPSFPGTAASVPWTGVTGSGRPADNATVNRVFAQASAPAGAVDGDVWHDTDANPQITYYRVSGVWVTGPNLATNTNQLTDGAQLGSTANWPQVTGTGRPADNATVGARTGVNLRNTADTVTLGDGDVITAQGTAADFVGRGPWATTSTPIANVLAPGANLFPYPRPLAGSTAAALGWRGGISAGEWGPLGGRIYIAQRVSGGPALLDYYGYTVSIPGVAGTQFTFSVVGYTNGPLFTWLLRFLRADNSQTGSLTYATYDAVSGRTRATATAPGDATQVDVFAEANWPASGAYQDFVFWDVKLETGAQMTPFVSSRLNPRQDGADVTSSNTAADFSGRGALATLNTAAWGSHISGRPTELTDGRITAALDASGDLARNLTESRLNSSNVLRRSTGGLYTGDLAATVGARAGTNLFRSDGSTVMSQSEVRTAEGTAADFAGRQWGATATEGQASNARVGGSANMVRFSNWPNRALYGWVKHDWDVATAFYVNLDGQWAGPDNYLWQFRAGNLSPANRMIVAQGVQTSVPVAPGQIIIPSIYVAGDRTGSIRLEVEWFNAAGSSIGWTVVVTATVSQYARNIGGAACDRKSNMTRLSGVVTVPATVDGQRPARAALFLSCYGNDESDPFAFYNGPMIELARSDQTVPSPFSPGPDAYERADITGQNTAADFTGRGPWATQQTPVLSLVAPNPNLFPFPSPIYAVYGGTTPDPSTYGWIGAPIGAGYWQEAGGPIYYRSRGAGAPAADEYHLFDVPNAIAGLPYTVSLNGYMSGGNFYPYVECLDGSKTILSNHPLAYDGTSQRYRVTFTAPANTAFIRVAVLASYPAATGYQDVVFSRIKVEHGSQMTPFNSAPEVTPRQSGADVTGSNTAADFSGRGALATANYYRQASDPGAVTDGSLWTDTSVTPNVLKQRIAGVWQTLATANTVAAQLYATASPKARVKTRAGTGSATTDTVTVTASGGSGGYSYSWTQQAGTSATATASTSATTAFQYTLVGLGEENVTTWECVVTDSAGAKASALVRAVFVETS